MVFGIGSKGPSNHTKRVALNMSPSFVPAPIWRRLLATLYDLLLLLALWLTAILISLVLTQLAGLRLTPPMTRALLFTLSFGFFGYFWVHGGQTLGMRAWRLHVRRTDGAMLHWPAALHRFVLMLLLGLSVLWCWLDPQRRAWHDRLSGTHVMLLPKKA